MSYKKNNYNFLIWVVIIILLSFLVMGCQQMSPITNNQQEENPLQEALRDASYHLSGGPFITNALSVDRNTNNALSDVSDLHGGHVITNVTTNMSGGHIWFNLDEGEVDTVIVRDQSTVNVELLNAAGDNVSFETNGMFSNRPFQIFEGASGPWYLKISTTNEAISQVIISIARSEGHQHE